ncbi:MAG: hypothetical protein V2A54_07245, partial [Bacteroidota bacterium]
MKKLLIVLFFLIATRVNAQEVVIRGTAPTFEGENITLNSYGDLLTFSRKEIASATIDKAANFSFKFKTTEPVYIFFQILNVRSGLFILPGTSYDIVLPSRDSVYRGYSELEYSIYPIDVLCDIKKPKDD